MLEGLHPVFFTLLMLLHTRHPQKNSNTPRQVFWLPRPFSCLPIAMVRDSGDFRLKGFLFLNKRKRRGHSGGTTPDFHGIPY